MIVEPEILFLDEPFSALDFPTKIKLMEDFKQIIEAAGTTTAFVSHDLMEINYLTNRLAIIVNGEVKQSWTNTKESWNIPIQLPLPFLMNGRSFISSK